MSEITVTPAAHTYLSDALSAAEGGVPAGIRVGVKKAGCSGYEYLVEYVYEPRATDKPFVVDNVTVFVDEEILVKFLLGTSVDYRQEGLNVGLVFDNPNVEAKCGCGESFALKEKEA